MKILFVFLVQLLALSLAKSEVPNPGQRILGSEAEDGQFPFIAGMWISDQVGCTGTILDERHVLSAYSCLMRVPFTHVLVGTNDWTDPSAGQLYPIQEWIGHPNYTSVLLDDIAIVRLAEPIQYGEKVQPVNLVPIRYRKLTMVGWSSFFSNHVNQGNRKIIYTEVDTVANDHCKSSYRTALRRLDIPSTVICTAHEYEGEPCLRDAGNPLMMDGYQIGVASFVWGDYCSYDRPDIFTDVSAHLEWIDEVINSV